MTNTLRFALVASVIGIAAAACDNKTPEPKPDPTSAAATTTTPASTTTTTKSENNTSTGDTSSGDPKNGAAGGDPLHGSFTMADATKDLKGTGPIVAKIDTSMGSMQCKLYDDKAPITVANFIGLATGKRAWRDPNSGQWVNKPAYDGTTFHRVIKAFMIQGGDPKGNGTGEPGYVIPDEIWAGAKHDRAGLLCMANRGHNTNGAQFFITDAAAAHLDGNYTIFGECAPLEVEHNIANTPVAGEKPVTPVKINSVTISRDDTKK